MNNTMEKSKLLLEVSIYSYLFILTIVSLFIN